MSSSNEHSFDMFHALRARARVVTFVVVAAILSLTVSALLSTTVFSQTAFAEEISVSASEETPSIQSDDAEEGKGDAAPAAAAPAASEAEDGGASTEVYGAGSDVYGPSLQLKAASGEALTQGATASEGLAPEGDAAQSAAEDAVTAADEQSDKTERQEARAEEKADVPVDDDSVQKVPDESNVSPGGDTIGLTTSSVTDDEVYGPVNPYLGQAYGPFRASASLTPQASANVFSDNKDLTWEFNSSNHTLTIRANGTSTNPDDLKTSLSNTSLPWLTSTTNAVSRVDIQRITFAANSNGGKIAPVDLTGWFSDYTSLISIDVTNLDVSRAVHMDKMFQNDVALLTITGMNTWKTESAISFEDMFTFCEKLETLDLSGVYTADGIGEFVAEGTLKNRVDMLSNMRSLRTITLDPDTALTDTGIDKITSRVNDMGVWTATRIVKGEETVWSGYGTDFVARYSANGAADNGLTEDFTFNFNPQGYFKSNPAVSWRFNWTRETLYILPDPTIAHTDFAVTEDYLHLPWKAAITDDLVKIVQFQTPDEDPTAKTVAPSSLNRWFWNYLNLALFNGDGLDVSNVTDYSDMFNGCISLANAGIGAWIMQPGANVSGMFEDCRVLRTVSANSTTNLVGTGISDMSTRTKDNGVWERTDAGKATDPWFGTTYDLLKRYNGNYTGVDHGIATYTFNTLIRGGRFESNDNAWWKYDVVSTRLTLGADDDEPGETLGKKVTETATSNGTGSNLPWLEVINGEPLVDTSVVSYVTSEGGIQPVNMAYWFKNYVALVDFDGTGIDTSATTDFTSLFENDLNLGNGSYALDISTWRMGSSSTTRRANMFKGLSRMLTLKLGPGVQLQGSNFESLDMHDAANGTWVRKSAEEDQWIGSSQSLMTRYASAGSEGSTLGSGPHTYFWDITLLRNVFVSNGNIWWEYTAEDRVLKIGATNPAGNLRLIEHQNGNDPQLDQPWLLVIGKAAGTGEAARTLGRNSISEVIINDKLDLVHPDGWFKDYVNLETIRFAKGLELSSATSLASLFDGCTSLTSVAGMGDFTGTSSITNLSRAFYGTKFTTLQGLDSWDVSNVTDFSYFLANNNRLNRFTSAAEWNTSAGRNFSYFFYNNSALTRLDIHGWDMTGASATGMTESFMAGMNSIEELTLGDKVILTESGIDSPLMTPGRRQISGSFQAPATDAPTAINPSVTQVWVGPSADLIRRYPAASRNFGNVTYTWKTRTYYGRFADDNGGDRLWWKYDDINGMLTIGSDADAPITGVILDPDHSPWADFLDAFYGVEDKAGLANVKTVRVETYNGAPIIELSTISLAHLFETYYTGLNRFEGGGLDTKNVTSFESMFEGAASLNNVRGVDNWNTGKVTSMHNMFKNTRGNIVLEGMENWNTSSVTDFSSMFEDARGVQRVTCMGKWDVSAATTFANMFKNATGLRYLDISFTPGNGNHMQVGADRTGMLSNVPSLLELTVGNHSVLADTELVKGHLSSRGSWEYRDESAAIVWFGTTKNLVGHYPATDPASDLGVIKYTWEEGTLRGRFDNENVWWQLNYADDAKTRGDLIIGVTDAAGDLVITETASDLPWADAVEQNFKLSDYKLKDDTLTDADVTVDADRYLVDKNGDKILDVNDEPIRLPRDKKIVSVKMQNFVTFQGATFAGWFEDYVALEHFDGVSMNVTAATDFSNLFKGCRSLIVVQGINDWKVHNVTTYDHMFDGCKSIRSLDIHSWEMNINATHYDMLKDLDSITSLYLGEYICLSNAALFNSDTRNATKGSWMRATKDLDAVLYQHDPWFGSSEDLIRRYTPQTNDHRSHPNDTYGAYYYWQPGVFRGRFENNDNAWWKFDRGTLTIGLDTPEIYSDEDQTILHPVIDDRANFTDENGVEHMLPWVKASSTDGLFNAFTDIVSVEAQVTNYNDRDWTPKPTDMSFWFEGYKGLKIFDGRNFDITSAEQSFESLFADCTALTTVNFSGWSWDSNMERTNMFVNTPSISSLLIMRVVLEGTGLGLDRDGNELASRAANAGTWVMDNNIGYDIPWFDCTYELVQRYPVMPSVAINSEHLYLWTSDYAGGRFDNNPNAWWKFYLVEKKEEGIQNKTLVIGIDSDDVDDNIVIDQHGTATTTDEGTTYSGATMQWAMRPAEGFSAGIPNIAVVQHVMTVNDFVVEDLTAWFAGMSGLKTFDGRFMDVSNVTNFMGLFSGCTSLQYVDIGNWDMHDDARTADVRDMLQNCRSLYSLTVGKKVVLTTASGLNENLTNREPNKGTWIYNLWFGSSSDLADDYPNEGIKSAAEALYTNGSTTVDTITYIWDEGNLGGRFPSNTNVWWRYTGVVRDGMVGLRVGLLRIGSDSEDNNAITETSEELPWRKLLPNVNTITEVRTAADGSYPVSVKNLAHWFGTYTSGTETRVHTGLDTFKGEGFILDKPGNQCISLEGMFEGATKLSTATGMDKWVTNSVTSYARMFYANHLLYDLDISNWDMTNAAIQQTPQTAEMFVGFGSQSMKLNSLTLGPNAVLEGTGLGTLIPSQQNGRKFHNEGDGVWMMGEALNSDAVLGDTDTPWWDSTAALIERYKLDKVTQAAQAALATKDTPSEVAPPAKLIHKYTWRTDILGGHFQSNANVWWKIDQDTRDLTIGLHDKNLSNATFEKNMSDGNGNIVVDADSYMTPWARLGATISTFAVDTTNGKVAPTTLEGWFDQDYIWREGGLAGKLNNHAWDANNVMAEWQRYLSPDYINLDWASTAHGYRPSDGYNEGDTFWTNWTNWTYWFEPCGHYETSSSGNEYYRNYAEKMFTPIYLKAGETYYMSLDFTTRVEDWLYGWFWGYPDFSFELYNTLDARNATHRYNGIHVSLPRDTRNLTHKYITFSVQQTGVYYVGFDAMNFSDHYGQLTGWSAKDLTVARYTTFKEFDGSGLDVSNCTSFERLFNNQEYLLTAVGMDEWVTNKVTNMSKAFRNTKKLHTIDSVRNWEVFHVTDFSHMFAGMNSVDATIGMAWAPDAAIDMSYMFYNNTMVSNANYLKTWFTAACPVETFEGMFKCEEGVTSALEDAAAISDWKVAETHGVNLNSMFEGAHALEAVDTRGWNLRGEDVTVVKMLCNTTSIRSLAFGTHTQLAGAYLGLNADGQQFTERNARSGGWIRMNASKEWFGSTADVVRLYPALAADGEVEGPYVYIWTYEQTGGNSFPSNEYAWWKYMVDS